MIQLWRLTAVRTVPFPPKRARDAQWATARRYLLLEEGVSYDPEVWLVDQP
jgi:hypothetical protein